MQLPQTNYLSESKESLESKNPIFQPLFTNHTPLNVIDFNGNLHNCRSMTQLIEIQAEERMLSIQERRINLRNMQIQNSREEFHLFKDQLEFFKEELKVDGVLPLSVSNTFQDYTFNKFIQLLKK